MPEFKIINLELISNPLNWIIVLLMVLIGGFAGHLLLPSLFPSTSNESM